jgi:hypothetical protein
MLAAQERTSTYMEDLTDYKGCQVFVAQASQAAEKYLLLSSRAERGICFFANPTKKADSSGKIRPRNDKIGVFPQLVQPVGFGPRNL